MYYSGDRSELEALTDKMHYCEAFTNVSSLKEALLEALKLIPGWDEYQHVTSLTSDWS